MKPNEVFVLDVLVEKYGGEYSEGEDPPDAYLQLNGKNIAVEVTRLVEHVLEDGEYVSRMAHDNPAINLANKIDCELKEVLPEGKWVFIIVPSPIKHIRKTSEILKSLIIEKANLDDFSEDVDIKGNRITISVYTGSRPSGKKVVGAVSIRYSDANIGKNACFTLERSIESKVKKCVKKRGNDEYWLALFNDYWLADKNTFRQAYQNSLVEHDFDKVLVIDRYREIYEL